jgi:hypothetical protein
VTGWADRLQRADTLGELMRAVQSFLAEFEASDIAIQSRVGAPAGCGSSADLKEWVIHLAVARTTSAAADVPESVKRLFAFFTEAATRLGQLEFELRSNRCSPSPVGEGREGYCPG